MNYKDNIEIKRFEDEYSLFLQVAGDLKELIETKQQSGEKLYFAISGGNSPLPLYRLLAENYKGIDWKTVELFWVDERLVPHDDEESNYGNAKRVLLNHLPLPSSNIHFVKYNPDAFAECTRYSGEIERILPKINDFPAFDLIWLGIGEDGHTASIFPGTELTICGVTGLTEHPRTKQKRITITEKLINNSREVVFIVTGRNKEEIVNDVLTNRNPVYPSSRIQPVAGKVKWYLTF